MIFLLRIHNAFFCCISIDAVFMDPDFGINRHEFDKMPITEDKLSQFLTQVKAVNTQDHCLFFSWCMPNQFGSFQKVLTANAYANPHSFSWYKHNQNVKGTNRYTFATELAILAYYPSREKASKWIVSNNPLERHNVLIGPTLKNYFKKDGTDEPLNLYEKPGWVEGEICSDHFLPGSTVVIPGGGAGGSLVGLLNKGMNCVVFERDPDQWSGLVNRIQALTNSCDEAIHQEAAVVISDYEPNCCAPEPRLYTLDLMTAVSSTEEKVRELEDKLEETEHELDTAHARVAQLEADLAATESLRQKVSGLAEEANKSVGKNGDDESATGSLPKSPAASAAPRAASVQSARSDDGDDEGDEGEGK